MEYIVNACEMKEIDRRTIEEIGVLSMVLMERAAYSVFEEIKKRADKNSRILIVCGNGNNGADGVALSRMLCLEGYNVTVYEVGNSAHYTDDMRTQMKIAHKIGVNIVNETNICEYNVIVDAIFGIGLSRDVEGRYKDIIKKINSSDAYKISVDIPSGINSSTAGIMGIAIKADMTVTFGAVKVGNILYPGAEYSGKVIVADIGFPQFVIDSKAGNKRILNDDDIAKKIPPRKKNSNKGTYGKLLVVAGSVNMCGAAYLCAKAAYRMGTGLVRVFTPDENRVIMQTLLPEAVLETYKGEPDVGRIDKFISESDCIVCGPGMGTGENTKILVSRVLASGKKTILDADALNQISKDNELNNLFHKDVVITPHVGEFSRLIDVDKDEIKKKPFEYATSYAEKYGITCVLKDARTITACADGSSYVNVSGNPGMSKGGSGDVLAGVIAALVCQGVQVCDAASVGVAIHGRAGDIAAKKHGEYAMIASELVDSIKEVMKQYENER